MPVIAKQSMSTDVSTSPKRTNVSVMPNQIPKSNHVTVEQSAYSDTRRSVGNPTHAKVSLLHPLAENEPFVYFYII